MTPSLPASGILNRGALPPAAETYAEPTMHGLVRASMVVIGLGFGGFLLWAVLAPLDSAVGAQGFVVSESHRKTVSILEGGTLKAMLVREGDKVAEGQVLLRLDEAQAGAQVSQLDAQRWAAEAKIARLRAELDDQHVLIVSPE